MDGSVAITDINKKGTSRCSRLLMLLLLLAAYMFAAATCVC
jgi:hypothetical protein